MLFKYPPTPLLRAKILGRGGGRATDIAGIPKKATQDSIGITENTLGILEGFQKK